MCLTGRVAAAAVLALTVACGGATPPPVTQPAQPARPVPATPGAVGVELPETRPVMTSSIGGRVSTAEGGKPLARARVTLTAPTLTESRVAITGTDGRYEFTNLPAGTYSIAVSRTGYATQRFGQRRSAPPATVSLAAGQKVTTIDVALPPGGVIVGQILDEDGSPFAGARVEALVSEMENNQPTLAALAATETDDRGNFRLTGLPEGSYYVSAFDPAFEGVGDQTGPLTYAPTFYPGAVFVEEARRVAVTPGVEPANKIVFTLQIVRPASVIGTLTTTDRRQLLSGAVIMSPVHAEGLLVVPTRDVMIVPDGSFSFRNIPPGRYQIRARGEVEPNGISLFATFIISVSGFDIRDVNMTLMPGASLEGVVQVDSTRTGKPPLVGLRVRAPFADGSTFGDSLTGDVMVDGTFRIRGLMTGSHYITVEALQYPWTLKSVLYKGVEIADSGIDVESKQEFKDVRVIITDAAAEIGGLVRDPRGRPASDALVLIIPTTPQFWTKTSRRFAVIRTDADGRYRVRGLPSGEYHAVATVDINETEAFRREVLQQLVERSMPVTIRDREQRALDLQLASLTAAPRTVSR